MTDNRDSTDRDSTDRDSTDKGSTDKEQQRRLSSTDRRRLAKSLLLLIIFGALVMGFRTWHGRALDIVLVHRFPSSDDLLPASVEVMVWEDDILHADAHFPSPESLNQLEHLARVPKGDYRVTYTVSREFGQIDLRFEQMLTVEEQGRYYLTYELADRVGP